jgi:TRAP-type C4-dicarboxylate transport system substrate-binding protein
VLDGPIGRELLLASEPYYLRGLCFYDAGSRSFYTKTRPVRSPADLSGLKIRVQESITALDMVRNLGGAPTPISWGELYTALQQGVVDGAENNPPSFHTSRHYEVCKYYTLNEHTSVPDVLVVSTAVWRSLDEQERQWLQEAADESVAHQRRLWREASERALEEVKAAGVEIIFPEKQPFIDKVRPMLENYRREPAVWDLIERIRATTIERDETPAHANDD